jgi:glutamate racemase
MIYSVEAHADAPLFHRALSEVDMAGSAAAVIGVFDSGVGGLSVVRALRQQLSEHPLLYIADQAHVPYGPRSLEEVRAFSEEVTRSLLAQGAGLVVVA